MTLYNSIESYFYPYCELLEKNNVVHLRKFDYINYMCEDISNIDYKNFLCENNININIGGSDNYLFEFAFAICKQDDLLHKWDDFVEFNHKIMYDDYIANHATDYTYVKTFLLNDDNTFKNYTGKNT